MERWNGEVVVVTGASSGIGLATSVNLLLSGMIVVGLARRRSEMVTQVSRMVNDTSRFVPYECDVTNETRVEEVFNHIEKNIGPIRVLVNNAGIARPGTFMSTTSDVWQAVFQTNVMGLLYCTQRAVKAMKARDVTGLVININSIEGHRVYTYDGHPMNIYSATKHAVTAITETFRKELYGGKIRFTSISPGFTFTNIAGNNPISDALKKAPFLLPKDVAEAIRFIISAPDHVEITEHTVRPLNDIAY